MNWRGWMLSLMIALNLGFAQAQTIDGTVVSETNNEPLLGANVLLLSSKDSSLITGTTTDFNGSFSFKANKGKYFLKISFLGMKDYLKPIEISQSIKLGVIKLEENAQVLKQVEIVDNANMVEQIGDTTQFNSDAFTTNKDAAATDLIEKMPGMYVQDGKMYSQGEQVKQVLVDGQPFFGSDPNAALKNLPAEVIAKIQVYNEKSEQSKLTGFDDGNTTKTINIITKSDFKNGAFGNVYAAAGYDNVYQAGGVVNYFNDDQRLTLIGQSNNVNVQNFSTDDLAGVVSQSSGGQGGGGNRGGGPKRPSSSGDVDDFLVSESGGISTTNAIGLNYTDKIGSKLSLNGSYFFNDVENNNLSNTLRDYYNGQQYSSLSTTNSNNMNHRANLRLEYKFSDQTKLLIRPSFNFQDYSGLDSTNANTALGDSTLTSNQSNYNTTVQALKLSNSIFFMHRFEKMGRSLFVNSDQEFNNSNAEAILKYNTITDALIDSNNQQSKLASDDFTISARARYTEPLAEKTMLQFGYEFQFKQGNSDKKTNLYDAGAESYSQLDSSLSNVATSTYLTNKAGLGIMRRSTKGMLMADLNYQLATLQADVQLPSERVTNKQFQSILPMMMWHVRNGGSKDFRLGLRSSTTAPTITQLQEAVDNSNPLSIIKGNYQLDQQTEYSLFGNFQRSNTEKGRVFFVNLQGNLTTDYITQRTWSTDVDTVINGITLASGSQLTSYTNLNNKYSGMLFTTYGFPMKKLGINFNVNADVSLSSTPTIINDLRNDAQSISSSLGVSITSNISEKIDFSLASSSKVGLNQNSLSTVSNSSYFNQKSTARLVLTFPKDIVFRTNLTHQFYTGLTASSNQNYLLVNFELGKKLFKQKGELSFLVYDAFNQNTNIQRTITQLYIEDSQSTALNRYFMLKFRYNFTKTKVV